MLNDVSDDGSEKETELKTKLGWTCCLLKENLEAGIMSLRSTFRVGYVYDTSHWSALGFETI